YTPYAHDDAPIHGNEELVWNGKLCCTRTSIAYKEQFTTLPAVVILDHRELLSLLEEEDHPGKAAISSETQIVIDDASMLEDTATKAFGWTCGMDELRASAQNEPLLTR